MYCKNDKDIDKEMTVTHKVIYPLVALCHTWLHMWYSYWTSQVLFVELICCYVSPRINVKHCSIQSNLLTTFACM